MGLLGIFALGIVTIFGVLILVISGLAEAVEAVFRRLKRRERRSTVTQGLLKLVLAALLTYAPFVAADRAERSHHWVDVDGNGILDPMENGAYDWVDINGGTFALTWAVVSLSAVGAAALASRHLPQPSRHEGVWRRVVARYPR